MKANTAIDITSRTDVSAISLLVAFDTPVKTHAGRIQPQQDGFVLEVESRRPRTFRTASGAVEVLRRLSRSVSSLA